MSEVDLSGVRAAVRRGAGKARGEARFERADLVEGSVFSVDPTLAATGWSVLTHDELALALRRFDTIRWTEGVSTVEEQAAAGDALYVALQHAMGAAVEEYPDIEVAIEAPPTGNNTRGGKVQRPESAIAAANRARCAAISLGLPIRPMVNIVHHKTAITANRGADKDEVKFHLNLLAQSLPIVGYPAKTNDNVRDSISVGITDLRDRRS